MTIRSRSSAASFEASVAPSTWNRPKSPARRAPAKANAPAEIRAANDVDKYNLTVDTVEGKFENVVTVNGVKMTEEKFSKLFGN